MGVDGHLRDLTVGGRVGTLHLQRRRAGFDLQALCQFRREEHRRDLLVYLDDADPEEVFDQIAAQTPLGHVTTPEEFASAVVFFASPSSRAVTGQNLVVDNGLVMG